MNPGSYFMNILGLKANFCWSAAMLPEGLFDILIGGGGPETSGSAGLTDILEGGWSGGYEGCT